MNLKENSGKEIPGIPGATLRKQARSGNEKNQEEFLERLVEDEEESEEDFIPQQELIEQ